MLPDVDGEAAVAGHRVLVGALQGDGGFGSSTDFTAEDHRLPKRTHHVWQGVEELWSHCTQETSLLFKTPPHKNPLIHLNSFTILYIMHFFNLPSLSLRYLDITDPAKTGIILALCRHTRWIKWDPALYGCQIFHWGCRLGAQPCETDQHNVIHHQSGTIQHR